MPGILDSVQEAFSNKGLIGNGFVDRSKSEMEYYLRHTSVFSTITHGSQTAVLLSGGETFTIADWYSIKASEVTNLKLVYYGACLTGKDGDEAINLVNATFGTCGQAVLGFKIMVILSLKAQ